MQSSGWSAIFNKSKGDARAKASATSADDAPEINSLTSPSDLDSDNNNNHTNNTNNPSPSPTPHHQQQQHHASHTLSLRKSSRRLSNLLSPSRQSRKASSSVSPQRSPVLPDPVSPVQQQQHAQNTQPMSLSATRQPQLGPHSEIDEHELNKYLADMESSFVPSPLASRYQSHSTSQLDPTVQSSSPQRRPNPHAHAQESASLSASQDTAIHDPSAVFRSHKKTNAPVEETHSSTHALSSPSTAAAQRSRLRAAAAGSSSPSSNATPSLDKKVSQSLLQVPSTLSDADVPLTSVEQNSQSNSAHATANGQKESHTLNKRPSYLNSHQASQRSSASSFVTHNSGMDTPGSHSTLRPDLTRVPSLGSVASSISDLAESMNGHRRKITARQAALDRLSEEPRSSMPPETPRNANHLADPSNTVLAQHVRDVQVPDTVAREYRQQHVPNSERKTPAAPSGFGRGRGDLTLKEQNSRIDKLSKENFDLKLKIHYLYQALQDRSDEGVKDMIAKNAQLQADLVKSQKEIRSLKKRLREHDQPPRSRDGPLPSTSGHESETDNSSSSWKNAQLEEEIRYLQSCVHALEQNNVALQQQDIHRETEKRRLAEKIMMIQNSSGSDGVEQALRDLLDTEVAKREQAEQRVLATQMELERMRNDRSPRRDLQIRPSSNSLQDQNIEEGQRFGSSLSGSTLIDQLKYENAGLKRDLSAQTSMLTSRNRERERLQQEIEDLKLVQRRGDGARSLAGDSILDRSVSRNNYRPTSRQSAATRLSQLSDQERDKYETAQAALRDENAALKMRNQDLQQELDDVASGSEHIKTLRTERDEAVRLMKEDAEWAEQEIGDRDREIDRCREEIEHLLMDLESQETETRALQQEMKDIRNSLNRVADDSEDSHGTIQNLREELITATGEIETLERSLRDTTQAKERLEVQAESSQNEISFLREEQEGDKLKISDLQSALRSAKNTLRDEKERLREFEELEGEARKHRDESRRLRKELTTRDEEASTYRDGLEEMEGRLREIFGHADGGRSTLLRNVVKMQQSLDYTLQELELARADIDERDRHLRDRNTLLDSSTAETRRLAELLDREKKARKHDQTMHERQSQSREAGSDKARPTALEDSYQSQLTERNNLLLEVWQRLSAVCGESWMQKYGLDKFVVNSEIISQDPTCINRPIVLTLKAIDHLNRNFGHRLRESDRSSQRHLQILEQALETSTERVTRLEQLPSRSFDPHQARLVEDMRAMKSENKSLKRELKILKQGAFALPGLPSPVADLERAAAEAAAEERKRNRSTYGTPSVEEPSARDRESALMRRTASSDAGFALAGKELKKSSKSEKQNSASVNGDGGDHPTLAPSEQRWILRLKELERMLRQERESRVLDRTGARQRLAAGNAENEELKKELERERIKNGLVK